MHIPNHQRLFVPSLSSCHEKATVAQYFGRILTRLGVVHFRAFRLFVWLLTTEFAACSKPPSRDNHRKSPYPRTQQRIYVPKLIITKQNFYMWIYLFFGKQM